jgi:hypothetical protein
MFNILPCPLINIFFVLSLVANFCKLVVLFGGKLENNEISNNFFEVGGGHYFKNKIKYVNKNIRCCI